MDLEDATRYIQRKWNLSDRDLDLLEKFEDFPNLVVVWLNNNKVIVDISLRLRTIVEKS